MKFADERGIKKPRWEQYEGIRGEDINFLYEAEYHNITDLLGTLMDRGGIVDNILLYHSKLEDWTTSITSPEVNETGETPTVTTVPSSGSCNNPAIQFNNGCNCNVASGVGISDTLGYLKPAGANDRNYNAGTVSFWVDLSPGTNSGPIGTQAGFYMGLDLTNISQGVWTNSGAFAVWFYKSLLSATPDDESALYLDDFVEDNVGSFPAGPTHVFMIWDRSGISGGGGDTIRVYLDNVLTLSTSIEFTDASAAEFTLGSAGWVFATTTSDTDGGFDNFKLWEYADLDLLAIEWNGGSGVEAGDDTTVYAEGANHTVMAGLQLDWDTGLVCDLRAGAVISYVGRYYTDSVWGFVASPGEMFSVIIPDDTTVTFDSGGTLDRIDIVEIRPTLVPYHSATRKIKSPTTGTVSQVSVNTRVEFGYEKQIVKGVENASPVAPAGTAGWVKLAEVYVAGSASAIDQDDIKDVRDSDTWTNESGCTVLRRCDADGVTVTESDIESTVLSSALSEIAGRILHIPKRDADNFITSGTGTIEGRVLSYKNLTINHDTTIKARVVYVQGDLTIGSSKVLTVEPGATRNDSEPINSGPMFIPGLGPLQSATIGHGVGGFGGDDGIRGAYPGGSGGGGYGGVGGEGSSALPGGASAGGAMGGDGGDQGSVGGDDAPGGGGGGFGGSGGLGCYDTDNEGGDGGDGGDLIFFIVEGNFVNNGTINNNGGDGGTANGVGGGGGGGGAIVLVAFGDSPTIGIINCEGGAGGTDSGGGGGGGHIELYAKTSSWGTRSVAGGAAGSGGGSPTAGSVGTNWTIDISTDKQSLLGGSDADATQKAWAGQLFRFLEGVF